MEEQSLLRHRARRLQVTEATIHRTEAFDEAIEDADVVMMLRIQRERSSGGGISNDYRRLFGMTAERAKRLREGQLLMHPGPVNHGVEIDTSVLESCPRCVLLEQVAAGVFVRGAVLLRAIERTNLG